MQIESGTYGIEYDLYFVIPKAGDTDFAATGDWTPATGDVKITKDGGAVANTSNLPTAVTGTGSVSWKLTLTATEMQADAILIQIVDSATKAVEDQAFLISTRMTGQVMANQGIIVLEVDTATFTATSTAFEAFRIFPDSTEEATADQYLQRKLLFLRPGNLGGTMTTITDYELANSKEKLTYVATATAEAPADGDYAVVL